MTTLDDWIDRFVAFVAAERGCSTHTVAAYARDLGRLASFAESHGIREPRALDVTVLRHFLAHERRRGLSARSQARAAAALRSFGRYVPKELVREIVREGSDSALSVMTRSELSTRPFCLTALQMPSVSSS